MGWKTFLLTPKLNHFTRIFNVNQHFFNLNQHLFDGLSLIVPISYICTEKSKENLSA